MDGASYTAIVVAALAGAALRASADPGEIAMPTQRPARGPLVLWYRKPAETWLQAVPIGNGRLAAMVFGGAARDEIQLN
jgi:alpha-L-fucosidase 2